MLCRLLLEYKYVVIKANTGIVLYWQSGDNFVILVPDNCNGTFTVSDDWAGNARSTCVEATSASANGAVGPTASAMAAPSMREEAEEAITKADVRADVRGRFFFFAGLLQPCCH